MSSSSDDHPQPEQPLAEQQSAAAEGLEEELPDPARRRLLKLGAYVPPQILGAMVLVPLGQATLTCLPTQCMPDQPCMPEGGPCGPEVPCPPQGGACGPSNCPPNS